MNSARTDIGNARHVVTFGLSEHSLADLRKQGHAPLVVGPDAKMSLPAMLSYLVSNTSAGDRTVALVNAHARQLHQQQHDHMMGALRQVDGLRMVREKTYLDRVGLIIENFVHNLSRLESIPLATDLTAPLAGVPVFIVAAGPSLDNNAHLLCEASKRGAVFAVNTSALAVMAHDCPIDVLVSIESIDASLGEAAKYARCVALDLSSNPRNFEATIQQQVTFVSNNPAFAGVAARLDTAQLAYGGSVATTALSLAHLWGADPIVLLGQDLAYTNGQMYATHTRLADMRARPISNGVVELVGGAERDAPYQRAGLQTQPRKRTVQTVPGYNGGTVQASYELNLFRQWFEVSVPLLSGRRYVNATEGGAHIAGFEQLSLAALLDELPPVEHNLATQLQAAVTTGKLAAVRAELRQQCSALVAAADGYSATRTHAQRATARAAVQIAMRRASLPVSWAGPEIKRLAQAGSLHDKDTQTVSLLQQKAQRVIDHV